MPKPIRLVIAGSRDLAYPRKERRLYLAEQREVRGRLDASPFCCPERFTIVEIISGNAIGIDREARDWAKAAGYPVRLMPPDYSRGFRRAPLLRNIDMAEACDALHLIWNGRSRGSKHMLDEALKRGRMVYVEHMLPIVERLRSVPCRECGGTEADVNEDWETVCAHCGARVEV